MKTEIHIQVEDQMGVLHNLVCPTDMGMTVKDICKAYDLPIEAVCGGIAMCATCHCIVVSGQYNLNAKSEIEEALLSECFNTEINSRLSCQIYLSNEMEGLHIRLADA